jgi:N-acetylmuramoyl-L-alanine amidase
MAKEVFLGVGHGGSDPGAVANGFKEADLNLSIALACQKELLRHGVTVGMSRTKNENDTLTEEIRECNAFNPDLAVDIHNNAGGGDGVEAFYHYGGGVGKTLAQNIVDEVVKIGQNSRGIKTRKNDRGSDYYGFIRSTSCPAVIVECAFVDNRKDMEIIDTEAERQVMGVAVAKGILKTLGIAYKEPAPATTGKIYRVQVGAYRDKANAEATQKKLKSAGFDAIIV